VLPRKLKIVFCTILIVCLIVGFAATASASPKVQWHTSGVYYDGSGCLIIAGYFANEGTVAIDKINWITLNVELQRSDGTWWLAYSDTWQNIEVILQPGQIYRCNLRKTNTPQQYRFEGYRVNGVVNYHVVTGSDA
jgi:hypothetical protein